MFELIFNDLADALASVATTSSIAMLVILGVVSVFNGLTMDNIMGAFGRAASGLLLLGGLYLVYQLGEAVASGDGDLINMLNRTGVETWNTFTGMGVLRVFGFYCFVLVGSVIVAAVKSFANR